MDLGYREIILNSEIEEIENLCQSNKHINLICQDDSLWRQIYEREGIPLPIYPSKSQFYLDNLLREKYHLDDAKRWADLLLFEGSKIEEETVMAIGIEKLPKNVFDDIGILQSHWDQFYEAAIESHNKAIQTQTTPDFYDMHALRLYLDEEYNFWLILDDPEYDYDITHLTKSKLITVISRILRYGLKFHESIGGNELELP